MLNTLCIQPKDALDVGLRLNCLETACTLTGDRHRLKGYPCNLVAH